MAVGTTSPWRIITGSGRTLTVTLNANVTDGTAMGAQTRACLLSVITGNCVVRISAAGTAATVTADQLVKTTDPPVVIAVSPGDKVSAWGLAAGTLFITELTH